MNILRERVDLYVDTYAESQSLADLLKELADTVETNVAQIKTVVGQIAYLLKQQAGDGKK